MKIIHHNIQYNRSDAPRYHWYHLTDTHLGSAACREELLRAEVEKIAADPLALVTLGGDMIDGISRYDKRHRESTYAKWLHGVDDVLARQVEYAGEFFAPIAPKIIAVLTGNHEDAPAKYEGHDIYAALVHQLARAKGCPPDDILMGVEGFLCLSFRALSGNTSGNGYGLTAYVHHGYGGGRKAGGDALHLQDMFRSYDADLLLVGHRHKFMTLTETVTRVSQSRRNVIVYPRAAVLVPSWLDYTISRQGRSVINTYAQHHGYRPSIIGGVCIHIDPLARGIDIHGPSLKSRRIA